MKRAANRQTGRIRRWGANRSMGRIRRWGVNWKMGRFSNRMDLTQKLRLIIMSMVLPLILCIVILLGMLGAYSVRYEKISHNVGEAGKFSLNFKKDLDLKMYYYMVGSRYQKELPLEDVEEAVTLADELLETTQRKESKESIKNISSYCNNLERRMKEMARTKDYDTRKEQWENNIMILTRLIQQEISNYIYYESQSLAALEQQMKQDVRDMIVIVSICVLLLVLLLLYRAFKFSNGISKPISQLGKSVHAVGTGEFDIPKVEASDYEIRQLSEGVSRMAEQIRQLLEDVKKEEKLSHLTQLQLLQAQVNPHFLYNTLDAIMWLVEAGKQDEAVRMISSLSVFFRTALSKGKDVIYLKEEVMHTRSYLDIQKVRYRDILDYEITLPKDLENIWVPKLTIQPLAENAIYHGVKEKRGKSRIRVTCEEQGEDILITVEDTGIGMEPQQLEELRRALESGERAGFGLAAVHERMKLYCGEAYGVKIDSRREQGTCVRVLISKNIQPES